MESTGNKEENKAKEPRRGSREVQLSFDRG
jgi:hypothetical protein